MKWGRPESQFSHWTIALSEHGYELLLGIVFLAHLFLAHYLPPAEDELYYWTWSQQFSWSYFDHPPITAWVISASTSLLGNTILGIRLPAVLIHLYLLYRLGTLSENKSVLTLLLFTPLSFFGAVLMTPDIPLVLFWFLYVLWAARVESDFSSWNDDPVSRVYRQQPVPLRTWLLGGVWLGLGLLSKYTLGLAPICFFFLLASKYRFRAWAQGFLFHGLAALLLFLPVLLFNFQFHFSPLLFQWNHTHHSVPFSFLFSYLGTQILLVGALPFLLIPWLIINYRSLSQLPASRTHIFFFIMPLIFFLYKSTHHFLEANWGLVAYLSFWPLSSLFVLHNSFRALVWSTLFLGFVVPLAVSLLLLIHFFRPLPWIAPHQDRLAKMAAQNLLIKQLAADFKDLKHIPVFTNSYQWTSYFRFHGFSLANQTPDAGRPSQYTLIPSRPCSNKTVLFFNHPGENLPQALECFRKKTILAQIPLFVRGQATTSWELVELSQPETEK
ncbi:MAG: ArnT family glycosyltransferase [Pseudomonadota bacterium]